jgi:hypothetical protein
VASVPLGSISVGLGITPVPLGAELGAAVGAFVVLGVVAFVVVWLPLLLTVVSGVCRRQPLNMARIMIILKRKMPAFFMEFPPILLEFDAIVTEIEKFTLVNCVELVVSIG